MHKYTRTSIASGLTAGALLGVVSATSSAHSAEPTAEQRRALVVVVNFKDAEHPDTDLIKENARSRYFSGSMSLAGYYSKVSQGAFTYVPAVTEQVVGPYELDLPQNPCNAGAVNAATRKALQEDGFVEGDDYDSLSIIQPGSKSKCAWSGLGSVPGPNTWINLGEHDEVGEALLIHEFGHNQGFGHSEREVCADGDVSRCTSGGDSRMTPMGGGGSGVGFSAPELISRGWLPGGQAVTVEKSATYKLSPLYGDGGDGVRALDIPMGEDRLVIEYRRPDPGYRNRAGVLDAEAEGVHAYRVPGGNYNHARLIVPTSGRSSVRADPIKSLTDTLNKIEVKVGASGNGSAVVTVNLNGVKADADTQKLTEKVDSPTPQTQSGDGKPASEDGIDISGTGDRSAENPNDTGSGAGTDTDSGSGTGTGNSNSTDATAEAGTPDLAETGADTTTLVLAASGAVLVVLGGRLFLSRRRRGHART
ncbi:LPXTG cell wall anchor domain-containing protein [Streptomyces sp. NBC_00090]|uniref:LAETG motif-containing sortase-dependent surface protein n=1 Tax=Streptomyces sp. NBC_00090 TaxID=2903619 RepID=UPI00324937C7